MGESGKGGAAWKGPEAAWVRSLFQAIAGRYDLANGVLSLGLHRRWRRELIAAAGTSPGDAVLDVAAGTGDLALEWRRALGEGSLVCGADLAPAMLRAGAAKAARTDRRVALVAADGNRLPFADDSFSAAGAAFGIRNAEDPRTFLAEMARVVRPGGRVLILEFGRPRRPALRLPYLLLARIALPAAGGLLTGRPGAYLWLARSSARFPCGEGFLAIMRSTGTLADLAARPLTGGVAWLYRSVVAG